MTIQLLEQFLKATEHDIDGLCVTREVSSHECLERVPSSVLFPPEARDLIETLLYAGSLLLAMRGNEFVLESSSCVGNPRLFAKCRRRCQEACCRREQQNKE